MHLLLRRSIKAQWQFQLICVNSLLQVDSPGMLKNGRMPLGAICSPVDVGWEEMHFVSHRRRD